MKEDTTISWQFGIPRDALIRRVFPLGEGGRLRFGWDASSDHPIADEDLNDWIPFTDYVMEGFVKYDLSISDSCDGAQLALRLHGGNRDEYIPGHIEFHLKQAGLVAVIQRME